MELKQYLRVIFKWLWLILLTFIIATVGSYWVTSNQPRTYQATAKLLVGQSLQSTNPNSGDISTSQLLAFTYVQVAKTSPVRSCQTTSASAVLNCTR